MYIFVILLPFPFLTHCVPLFLVSHLLVYFSNSPLQALLDCAKPEENEECPASVRAMCSGD